MKSGVKGFWKKQKNVIRRHKPPTIVTHSLNPVIDFSKVDNGFFDVDILRRACSVEVNYGKKN